MLLPLLSTAPSERLALVTTTERTTWSQLRQMADELVQQFGLLAGQRVGLLLPASAAGLAALCALDEIGAHAFLLDESLASDTIDQWAERFGLDAIASTDEASSWDVRELAGSESPTTSGSTVTLLTSGTEGIPKAATYTWARLAQPVRTGYRPDRDVWLLSYRIHLYAGLQVLLQALLNGQTLVVPGQQNSPDETARLMADGHVTCASATPSYWRRLVLFADSQQMARIPLRQITLGGEAADQAILDALRTLYPQARIVHIYATTELGRCFAVSDGLAGFPQAYLHDRPEPRPAGVDAQLKVENGQLYVRPKHGMNRDAPAATPDRAWTATGDLVELEGDRVVFAGRAGDMINVGGNKVRPAIVERTIRTVPGVFDVRVFGKSSSIAGQLVACEIVLATGEDSAEVQSAIGQACRAALQPYECPRLIECVPEIQLTPAGKITRSAPPQ